MPIIRRSDCVPLPIVVCPVVAVVMLESRVARCVHCVENVASGNQLDATNSDLLVINSLSTCFGHLYAHHQEIQLRSTAYNCPVVAVVMLESRVARFVHCVENVASGNQLDATNSDLLVINSISTYFGHLYAHHQEIQLRSTAYSCL